MSKFAMRRINVLLGLEVRYRWSPEMLWNNSDQRWELRCKENRKVFVVICIFIITDARN